MPFHEVPGNVPDDAVGQFLQQAFLGGRLPGDQGSNLQFVLSMLSPGAVQERRELLSPGAEAAARIPQEDITQALENSLGLTASPVEKFNTALNLIQQLDVSTEQAQQIAESFAPREPREAAQERAGAIPPRAASTEQFESRQQQVLDIDVQNDIIAQRRQLLFDVMTQARVNSDARRLATGIREDPEVMSILNIIGGLGTLAKNDALGGSGNDLMEALITRLSTKLDIPEEKTRGLFPSIGRFFFGEKEEPAKEGVEAPTARSIEDMDDGELLRFLLAEERDILLPEGE